MKELLFRVWNGANYEYNVMVGKFGAFYINPMNDGLDVDDSASLSPFNTKFSDDVVIEQFTGLTDKHGYKIFEGDKIKLTQGIGTVEWSKTQSRFMIWLPKSNKFASFLAGIEYEVIGNTHDNKMEDIK